MNEYGTLHEENGRYILRFERFFPYCPEHVYSIMTNAEYFTLWYPFATGEMDLRLGGEIHFDDGEGTKYSATITELEAPKVFGFREIDDLIHISLQEEDNGCKMVFAHTFDDVSWAVNTAAGWHRCLDVLGQIINGQSIEWHNNAAELREAYSKVFNMEI